MQDFDADWNQVWVLDNRVQQGHPLDITDEVSGLLRRTAPTVAIGEAEAAAALESVASATELLQRIAARIGEGSHRLSRALDRMYTCEEKEDLEGARQQLRELLSVEVVPHYRSIAERQLERLNNLP